MRRPDISPEEFLQHYGVKGMKWGVRKDRTSGGLSRKERQKAEAIAKRGQAALFNRNPKAANKALADQDKQYEELKKNSVTKR